MVSSSSPELLPLLLSDADKCLRTAFGRGLGLIDCCFDKDFLGGDLRGERILPLPLGEGTGDAFLPLLLGEGKGEGFLPRGLGDTFLPCPFGEGERFLSLLGEERMSFLSLRDSLEREISMSFLPLGGGDTALVLLPLLGLRDGSLPPLPPLSTELRIFELSGVTDLLFLGGGDRILDFFLGGEGDPDSSESSSLSEDDDEDSFLAGIFLGGGERDLFASLDLVDFPFGTGEVSRSDSPELSSSDSDFGGEGFFFVLTGGGDTEAGECSLFLGDGEAEYLAPLAGGGDARRLTGETETLFLRGGDGERRRLPLLTGGENLLGLRRLGSGVLWRRTNGEGVLLPSSLPLPLTAGAFVPSSSLESPEDELDESLPLSSSSCFL